MDNSQAAAIIPGLQLPTARASSSSCISSAPRSSHASTDMPLSPSATASQTAVNHGPGDPAPRRSSMIYSSSGSEGSASALAGVTGGAHNHNRHPSTATAAGMGTKGVASKRRGAAGLQAVTNSINLDVMLHLQAAFHAADTDGDGQLDMEGFVQAFTGMNATFNCMRHCGPTCTAPSTLLVVSTVSWVRFCSTHSNIL